MDLSHTRNGEALYRILVNIFLIRHLWRAEEIEKAFTSFSLCNWFCVLCPFLGFLFQNLGCQILPRNPLNLCPATPVTVWPMRVPLYSSHSHVHIDILDNSKWSKSPRRGQHNGLMIVDGSAWMLKRGALNNFQGQHLPEFKKILVVNFPIAPRPIID